jgi:deoxyribonuclease-4
MNINIGCHLSVSGGYENMGRVALSIGANTFQFFTRNPRGGGIKTPSDEDINGLAKIMEEHNFAPVIAHAPYTFNPCAADEGIRKYTIDTMIDDIKLLEKLPRAYYNFHPGSHVSQGAEVGIAKTADSLNAILKHAKNTTVLIETMAGKGSEVGRNFEELAAIYDGVVYNDKLRVCFDTCHTHDAGYDIIHDFDGVMDKFDRILGKNQIAVFHINDSKNVAGAAKDRHENIGFGEIGFDALNYIVHHKDFTEVPKILESPYVTASDEDKIKSLPPYKQEIRMLREGRFNPELIADIRSGK